MCYPCGIPSDFRNGFTFSDAAGLWKGEECHEESAYHEGLGKKIISQVSVGLNLNHTSIEPPI